MDCVIAAGVNMSRVPMGLPIMLPMKNGFGIYKSPNLESVIPASIQPVRLAREMIAKEIRSVEETLDTFGYHSSHRKGAIPRRQAGAFDGEIVPRGDVDSPDRQRALHGGRRASLQRHALEASGR